MFIRRGLKGVLLVAVLLTGLYLVVFGPPEALLQSTPGPSAPGEATPGIPVRGSKPPDHPVSVRVRSELELEGRDRTRRSSHVYRIAYRPPNRLRVRVQGADANRPDSHELVFDGRRYALYREGELFTAGTVDTDARMFDALPLPARHTYAVSFLLGDTPYLRSPGNGKQAGEAPDRSSGQRVEVTEGGVFRRATGPTRELKRRYGPYGDKITYAETATVLPRDRIPSDTDFTVSPRTLASARGTVGARLPEHTFRSLDGSPVDVHDFDGPRLINLWATWCPPCVEEIPALNRLQEEYRGRLTVIGISQEKERTIRRFKNKHEMGYPVWRSPGEFPAPYRNYRGLPTSYLIDGRDRIRRVVSGARSYDQWRALIESELLEP